MADKLYFKNGKLVMRGDALAMSADCCCGAQLQACEIDWTLTDEGFIAGGQEGAYREYNAPGDVTASPWYVHTNPPGLRIDWEDSDDTSILNTWPTLPPGWTKGVGGNAANGPGCSDYNPRNQIATASGTFTLANSGYMRIVWEGMGEQQDPGYELMAVFIDGERIARARAPGGGLGCAVAAPIVSEPPSPICFHLDAGEHAIEVRATTNDSWYHVNCYYQFKMYCGVGPCTTDDGTAEKPCCHEEEGGKPVASFTIEDLPGSCKWKLTSTSTPGTCSEFLTCEWEVGVSTNGFEAFYSFDPSEDCEITIDFLDCNNEWTGSRPDCDFNPLCDSKTVTVTLTVRDQEGCWDSHTETLECGGGCPDWCADVTITPTGIEDGEGNCQYEICLVNVYYCGDPLYPYCPHKTPVVHWEVPGAGEIPPRVGQLLEGECDTFYVYDDETLFWTLFDNDNPLGCQVGDGHIVPVSCKECNCCTEAPRFCYVTIDWAGDNGACFGCPSINGTYELVANGGVGNEACSWSYQDLSAFSCDGDPPEPQTINIYAYIQCGFEGEVWLSVDFFAGNSAISGRFEIPWLPDGPPHDCSGFHGLMPIIGVSSNSCDLSSATLSVDMGYGP